MNVVASLFPPRTRVIALPSQSQQRVLLADGSVGQRWRDSAAYPAYRRRARLRRALIRGRAALGFTHHAFTSEGSWALKEFVADVLPGLDSVVVLFGTPGPSQKLTVQLRAEGRLVGYAKIAESKRAQARLHTEWCVLRQLSPGLGPQVLRFGEIGSAKALVVAPVEGRPVAARPILTRRIREVLSRFATGQSAGIDAHPWAVRTRQRNGAELDHLIERLVGRPWSVLIQHGDFAPWNLLASRDGAIVAIDWEYGSDQGMDYLDAAYFILQTGYLMRRWRPGRARDEAIAQLGNSLPASQADALVRLAAFDAREKALADGHDPESPLQAWRWAVYAG